MVNNYNTRGDFFFLKRLLIYVTGANLGLLLRTCMEAGNRGADKGSRSRWIFLWRSVLRRDCVISEKEREIMAETHAI